MSKIKNNTLYNYKLVIEYDGADFLGWQRQSYSKETIQQYLEDAIEVLLKEKINLIAAGRTDAGVHALNQTANFRTNQKIQSDKFLYQLNSILPETITVKKITKAAEDFHARYSAKQREYIYKITLRKKSVEGKYFHRIYSEPDFKKIDSLINFFKGDKSFKSLCKNKEDKHSFRCSLSYLKYSYSKSKGELIFKIRASRFLHSMVRGITGCLIDAGREKYSVDEIKNKFSKGEKIKTQYLPANALFLNKIYY
ncbi:MAG: tRNA pseudouridine(38-40) synthase TruA [Bacteroidetes bacterium]|nr:tRNA pseudouridine(38-40) synthase TruA [Bacteroidota bacterium]